MVSSYQVKLSRKRMFHHFIDTYSCMTGVQNKLRSTHKLFLAAKGTFVFNIALIIEGNEGLIDQIPRLQISDIIPSLHWKGIMLQSGGIGLLDYVAPYNVIGDFICAYSFHYAVSIRFSLFCTLSVCTPSSLQPWRESSNYYTLGANQPSKQLMIMPAL